MNLVFFNRRNYGKEILDIFKRLAHEEGKCVIIVTHPQNVCDMADEVYDLKKVK